MPATDPVADLLRNVNTTDDARAAAWDAFHSSASADDLTAKLKALNIPNDAKADLWDLKHGAATPASNAKSNVWDINYSPDAKVASGDIGMSNPSMLGAVFGADNLKSVASAAGDLATGFGKKLVETGVRGGALLRQIPGVDAFANSLPSAEVNITPDNTTQKVGGMLEQAAEVAAPARGLMALGEKAAVAAAPKLAPLVGGTMARILPRAAIEGAGAAGLATAQGATPNEALASGVLGAAAPTIGEAAVGIANKLRESAAGSVDRFFNPGGKAMKRVVEKRMGEVLDRGSEVLGTLGRTREGAAEAFSAQRQAAGEAVDEALKQYGSDTVKDAPQRLMAALDTAKAPYIKTRIVSAQEAAAMPKNYTVGPMPNGQMQVEIPLDQTKYNQIEKLKDIVKAHGADMTVDDLVGVRRAWDEVAYRRPGTTLETAKSDAQKWAKKMGGDAIRAVIGSDKPELAAVNREFSFWKDIQTVMDDTVLRKRGQVGGLLPGMAEGAGQVAMAAAKGSLGQVFLVGKMAKTFQQITSSPRWASVSANIKNGLANSIASGNQAATSTWLNAAAARVGAIEAPREINLNISGSIGDAATP